MAQWIRHRPTEPGIAGSSPAGVIVLSGRCKRAMHHILLPRDAAASENELAEERLFSTSRAEQVLIFSTFSTFSISR